jgi:hypothetical protein
MTSENLVFEKIQKVRGDYYVEYHPPIASAPFASLSVVLPDEATPENAASAMEAEISLWLMRYPLPIMASAFDGAGDLFDLSSVRPCDHLFGLLDDSGGQVKLYWMLLKNAELPDRAINPEYLKAVYSDVPYKTSSELRQEGNKRLQRMRIGWLIVFLWVAVVPAAWAIVEWAGPDCLALTVLFYSFWRATVKALKLLGKWRKSPREIEKEEETRQMKHHHYHCKQNPEGFMRLKIENFDRQSRMRIQQEALDLKLKQSTDKHS